MLQQTNVTRVLGAFPRFLRRFPTLDALATARRRDVILAWQGMGYNNRAVRLHLLAMTLRDQYDGRLPRQPEVLRTLPGIGRYTAHALANVVYRKRVPVVDVNIRRFYSRYFFTMRTVTELRRDDEMWTLAARILPQRQSYVWNQALMDVGAMICTARAPLCSFCPVAQKCLSRLTMDRTARPTQKREPTMHGVPNRIYRGRIIEQLRRHHGRAALTAARLGILVDSHFTARQGPWMDAVLHALEHDGLITVRRNGSSTYVSLA
jgi:A/G-specific adenine glycosylase